MPEQLANEIHATLASARSQFEYLRDLGLESLVIDSSSVAPPLPGTGSDGSPVEAVLADLVDCQRCGLGKSRTNLVYGVGNPDARLVLVGDAPGRDEDLQGEPFLDEAGQLLDKILLAMGMKREEVYLCTVLKCLPPHNQPPRPDDVAVCETFLARQILAIRPEAIIGLGRFAVQSMLKTDAPITALRGQWQRYQGIPLMPTYHPAYLLSHPEGKRDVWEDMKEVLRLLQGGGEGS